MHIDWHGVRRRVSQVATFMFCWAFVVLILEGIIAPFGSLRRSFPVYGAVVPIAALSMIVFVLWRGWLRIELPDVGSSSRGETTQRPKRGFQERSP